MIDFSDFQPNVYLNIYVVRNLFEVLTSDSPADADWSRPSIGSSAAWVVKYTAPVQQCFGFCAFSP